MDKCKVDKSVIQVLLEMPIWRSIAEKLTIIEDGQLCPTLPNGTGTDKESKRAKFCFK
jgi:hypothetical protein